MRSRSQRLRRRSLIAVASVVAVLSVSGYAFTASNTVPAATLGQGSSVVSGYTVSAVAYTLNTTTPTNLDQVAFTIVPAAATTVKIQLFSGGPWYTCANSTGSVTCNTITGTQATALATTTLNVVASQ